MKFNEVLTEEKYENHQLWYRTDGNEGERLDLARADLRRADLTEAYLWRANLAGADLRWANLARADLRRANLEGAKLVEAYLRRANLLEADLAGTSLWWANLLRANLEGADLRRANLAEASLAGATGVLTACFENYQAVAWHDGVNIGCESRTYDDWLENGREIGEKNNYTPQQIDLYLNFVRSAGVYFGNLEV